MTTTNQAADYRTSHGGGHGGGHDASPLEFMQIAVKVGHMEAMLERWTVKRVEIK